MQVTSGHVVEPASAVAVPGAHAGHRTLVEATRQAEDVAEDASPGRHVTLVCLLGRLSLDGDLLGAGPGQVDDGVGEAGDLADDVPDGLDARGAGGEDAADLDALDRVVGGGGVVGGHETPFRVEVRGEVIAPTTLRY
jgi:hypothetical protein